MSQPTSKTKQINMDQTIYEAFSNLISTKEQEQPYHRQIWPRSEPWLSRKGLQTTRKFPSMSHQCIQE